MDGRYAGDATYHLPNPVDIVDMGRPWHRTSNVVLCFISIAFALSCKQFYYYVHLIVVDDSATNLPASQHVADNRNASSSSTRNYDEAEVPNRSSPKLLLSVPFYVHDQISWMDAIYDGKPIEEQVLKMKNPKHTDDYWFLKAALQHPMRTLDPSEAKLFVIPSLQNMFDSRSYFKDKNLCVKGVCNGKLMALAGETILNSTFFQQFPERHIAIASHFARHKDWWKNRIQAPMLSVLYNSHNVAFEDVKDNAPERISFSKIHVGTACLPLAPIHNKTLDITMIATLKPNDERFRDRDTICTWLQHYNVSSSASFLPSSAEHLPSVRVGTCGWGAMCPTLADSKLGFHVRGDTPSSSRLYDTILSGTVPIFTLQQQYDAIPDFIDFRSISYFMDMETIKQPELFRKQLEDILLDTQTFRRKLDLLLQNRYLFDWKSLYPFDMFMYRLQVQLYPDTAHTTKDHFGPHHVSILRLKL